MRTKILYFFILTLCGCIVVHNEFSIYKKPVFEGIKTKNLHLNGIYYIKNPNFKYPTPFIYFYDNGTAYLLSYVQGSFDGSNEAVMFWSNIEQAVDHYRSNWSDPTDRDMWGCYTVKDDSIWIQSFYRGDQSAIRRNMTEHHGIINSDGSIEIIYTKCKPCHKVFPEDYNKDAIELYLPTAKYSFFKTDKRPDNTKAWFLKKKWYRKELHESRK